MRNKNSTTKTFDMIKLLLQNLFDIAYLAFCYTSMFPRSILWSRLCLTKLNVRLHLLIFEHNFLMSIVMLLLRWWCSAKSKVFKILLTMAYKNNLVAVCNKNINDAKNNSFTQNTTQYEYTNCKRSCGIVFTFFSFVELRFASFVSCKA